MFQSISAVEGLVADRLSSGSQNKGLYLMGMTVRLLVVSRYHDTAHRILTEHLSRHMVYPRYMSVDIPRQIFG